MNFRMSKSPLIWYVTGAFVLLQIADAVLTSLVLKNHNVVELNPVMSHFMGIHYEGHGWLVMKFVVTAFMACYMITRDKFSKVIWFMIIMYVLVVINNISLFFYA